MPVSAMQRAWSFFRITSMSKLISRCSIYIVLCASALSVSPVFSANTGQNESIVDDHVQSYIDEWVEFYPSAAFSQGLKSAAWEFEDFSQQRVADWLEVNHQIETTLLSIPDTAPLQQRIDARVLLRQSRLELERWEQDRVLSQQPQWYAEMISHALTYVLVREELAPIEKYEAVLKRLKGIRSLCRLGIKNLENGNPVRTESALKTLEQTAVFYEENLLALTATWIGKTQQQRLKKAAVKTAKQVRKLVSHIGKEVLPNAAIADSYGKEAYTRKLAIYADNSLTPEQLALQALREINQVRGIMQKEAHAWWFENHVHKSPPQDEQTLLLAAMAAMENERTDNRQDFLASFTELTQQAEDFLIRHDLATVPQPRTLFIALSPDHFAGAAVGGVYPTGPFNTKTETLFYLPSVPDSVAEKSKEGFYRSFNDHFNTMITAHEMFPGHYLQSKVAVNHAAPVRSLFANDIYIEGWGSFSEQLMLDAGWAQSNRLTRLAHLRKRLENATRAYVSVMVHTNGWSKEQLAEFATKRGLVPPQFATNLWSRVMHSPLQLITYFVGFHGIQELWQQQRQLLGDDFVTKDFVDAFLRAGPIPIDALGLVFKEQNQRVVNNKKTVLVRMFEWWNAAYKSEEPFTEEAYARYFTDDIVFVVNGRRSQKGIKSLTQRFNQLKQEIHAIEIMLPFKEEFAEGNKIFTYHLNRGKTREGDPWSGYTHVMGYVEIKDGKIDLLNFLHYDEP